jgi:hypothetical protein
MRIAWTKSSLPLSKLILWGLSQPVSHVVIEFEDNLVFQSNLLGTHIDYWPHFKNHVEVVFNILIPMDKDLEDKVYTKIMDEFDDHPYGYGAFLYFTWRALLKKLFKMPLPKTNPWGSRTSFLCVGIIKGLDVDGVDEGLRELIRTIPDVQMISPYDLFVMINSYMKSKDSLHYAIL